MKKRILSMLLLVAMLVTALPLFALPTFAGTEEGTEKEATFEEKDYNALYVTEGLVMAADFFKMNEYWNPAAGEVGHVDYAAPETGGGTAFADWMNTNFLWTDPTGMRFKAFSNTTQAFSPVRAKEGYVQFRDDYNASNGMIYFTTPPSATAQTGQAVVSFDSGALTKDFTDYPFVFNGALPFVKVTTAGDVTFHNFRDSSYIGKFCIYKVPSWVGSVDNPKTADIIGDEYDTYAEATADLENVAKAQLLDGQTYEKRSASVCLIKEGDTILYTLVVQGDIGKKAALSYKSGEVFGYTQSIELFDGLDSYKIRTEDGTVYEVMDDYTADAYNSGGTKQRGDQLFLGRGYSGAHPDLRIYAYRHYTRVLKDEEIRQNHFADLMKWFKLDIKAYTNLGSKDRADVIEAMQEFTIQSDRDAVAKALKDICDRVAYDFLLGDLTEGTTLYAEAAQFVATAKAHQLSVAEVKLLPEEYRMMVYVLVNRLDGVQTAESIQDKIDKKVDDIIKTYYGKYLDNTEYDYRDIYARQDELHLAIDFFDAKASDGPVYVGKSYEDWAERYAAFTAKEKELKATVTVGDTAVPYWQTLKDEVGNQKYATLKDALIAEAGYANATELETAVKAAGTKRPDNWSELLEKYLWKGNKEKAAESFEAKDLGASYPHDNIRYYGDGTLICSKNNTVKAHLEDNDTDITYQVVGKVIGVWRLRGFRMRFTGATTIYDYSAAGLQVTGTEDAPIFTVLDSSYGAALTKEERPTVSTNKSVDITVALDKHPATDAERYYSYEWNSGKYTVTEVPAGTPGAYGPVFHQGSMDMSIFMNGEEKYTGKNIAYRTDSSDTLGYENANTYYALRIYKCVLTEAEVRQNHFADLAGLYDLDLSLYYRLGTAAREALHDALRTIELGTDKGTVVAAYEQAIRDNYYDTLDSDSEAGLAFTALAAEYRLKIESLLSISSVTRERIYTAMMNDPNVASGAAWLTPILQGKLETMTDEIVRAHYAESRVDTLHDLLGYQINQNGEKPGMRAVFAINEDRLEELRGYYLDKGISVTLGMMLLPAENALDAVTVEDGRIKLPESTITSVVAYENGNTDEVFYMDDATVYTLEYYPEGEDVNRAVAYVGYVCIEIEGEEPVFGYAYYNGNIASGNAFSLTELALYVKDTYGMAHKNIQTLTNAAKEESYASLVAGKADLSDYAICVTAENHAEVSVLQELVSNYLGVTLKTVGANKLDTVKHVLYLGECDTVHEDPGHYGIETRGNNLYLFYNDAANADATLARFAAILDMALADGFYQMADGVSYVYHARGLAE